MSLYGNIASTAPFQFDRIFGSRSEMDQYDTPEDKFVDDGVYAGRYVLVKYDTKNDNAISVVQLNNDYAGIIANIINGASADGLTFTLEQNGSVIKSGSTDPRLIPNQIYAANFADSDLLKENPDLNRYFFFEFTGDYEDKTSKAQFKFIKETEIAEENKTQYLYPIHYALDKANYSTIDPQASTKGYDGTIWMKTYIENDSKYYEKYIYIGSLNASLPALKVTPEAPEGGFRLPHLNITDSDTYDLHITTPYGFRVANTVPEMVEIKDTRGQRVPIIGEGGVTTGEYQTRKNSDVNWQEKDIVSDNADGTAIYYNKAGFDVTKNHIDEETENTLSCNLTGYSGQMYAVCDEKGNVNDTDDVPDIYELQVKLPILGNVVAELWNLAYGTDRNLDIAWEDGYDPKRSGKRLLPIGEEYTPEEANTIAGCINSMHDLMGMIIVEDNSTSLPTDLKNYGLGYIYYFSKLKRFYRVEQVPYYNEANKLSGNDFTYEQVTGIDSYTFVPGLYYNSNKTILNSYTAGDKYIKKLSAQGKEKVYEKIPWAQMLDVSVGGVYEKLNESYYYVTPDLVADGKTYYTFTATATKPTLYKANTYFQQFTTNGTFYKLDANDTMTTGVRYYTKVKKDNYSLTANTWLTKNSPNGSKFYINNEIATKTLTALKQLLKSKASYDMQSSSVFFYKDSNKVYQPVLEFQEGVDYYIGANWQPKLDWDENNKKFVYLYYPTSFYPTTLIACPSLKAEKLDNGITVTYNIYFYDSSRGWIEYNINSYAEAIAKNIYSFGIEGINTNYDYCAFYVNTTEQLVDAKSLVTDGVYVLDANQNYIKATVEWIEKSGAYYKLTDIKEIKHIYKPNKYYIKSGNDYALDSRTTKSSNQSTVWYVKKNIIIKDSKGYYPDYSIWDAENSLIPGSVELYVSDTKLALTEMESFARQLNTAHGLLLKINQTLDLSNTNTREKDSVKGIMNQMDDILNKFATMQPGDFLIVDGYGRMHGAKAETGNWIDVKVKPDPENPTVKFEHADPGAEGIWVTPTVALSTGTQAVVAAVKIDNKGHLDKEQVTGVSPDQLLFTIGDYTRTFAEWITWAANQGGGSGAVTTDWIPNAANPFYYSIDKGRLRAEDGKGLWTLETNPAGMLTLGTVNSRNVTLDKTSSYNSLLPSDKQFTITLGYTDTDMFNTDYTATTVNTETFSIDLREALAAPALTQGSKNDQNLFTPTASLDTTNTKEVSVTAYSGSVVAANTAIATNDYSVGTAIDLDTTFANKLAKNNKYSVAFQAISNNDGYKNSTVTSFDNYVYEKTISLDVPTLTVEGYLAQPGDLEYQGQSLKWTSVTADGVTDIKYTLKKDGVIIFTTADREYILLKANASEPSALNGIYTVEASGTYDGTTITSDISNGKTVDWFEKLATPSITTKNPMEGVLEITWPSVANAVSYKLYDASGTVQTVVDEDGNSSYTYELTKAGTYYMIASAGDSYQYYDSDKTDSFTLTTDSSESNYITSNIGADTTFTTVNSASWSQTGNTFDLGYDSESTSLNSLTSTYPTEVDPGTVELQTSGSSDPSIWTGGVAGYKFDTSVEHNNATWTLTSMKINGTEYANSGSIGEPLSASAVEQGKTIQYANWSVPNGTITYVTEFGVVPVTLTIELVYTTTEVTHNWVKNSSKSTAATCTTDGETVYECTGSGDATCDHSLTNVGSYSETIKALGHDYQGVVTEAATCGEDGVETYTCSRCSDSYTITIAATGVHTYGEWIVDVEATATTAGSKHRTCEVCGNKDTATIPATGEETTHNYSTSWTQGSDTHWHACTDEGCDSKSDEAEHDDKKYVSIDDNWEQHQVRCSVCDMFMANGDHIWDSDNKCELCGLDRTKHNHTYGDSTLATLSKSDTNYAEQHTVNKTCTVCGYTDTSTDKHIFIYTPQNNGENHNITCVCGYNTVGNCYDDDGDKKCDLCKGTYISPETVHHYSTEWSSDDTYHWHACTDEGCDSKSDTDTHTSGSASYAMLDESDASYTERHEITSICSVCDHETITTGVHIYKDSNAGLNGYTSHNNRETHTKKCLKCNYETTEECSGSQDSPKVCQYCGQSLLTVSQGQIKTPVLTSIDSGDTSVCKFSLVRDLAVELKAYVVTFYVNDVAIAQNTGSPHWTYTYDDSTAAFTITITGFPKCNTTYSITAEAADQNGNYDTSERSAALSFTTGHLGTISTVTYINKGVDVGHQKQVKCSNCEDIWEEAITEHDWGDPKTSTTGHTHTRTCIAYGCTAVKTEDCQYDSANDDTCTACGGKKADTHVWGETPTSNNDHTTHTYYCAVNGCDGSKQEDCDFQSTEDTCRLCGQNKNHNATWDTTATTHRKYCTNCQKDVIPLAKHTWNNVDYNGQCTTCQYECKHGVAATGVSWFTDWSLNADGTHSRTCGECGYTETESHTWGDWDNGTRSCEKCGATDAHVGHSYEYTTNVTQHQGVCQVCGYTLSWENHDWDTLDHNGQCLICGETCKHTYASGTSAYSDWSNSSRTCAICGHVDTCSSHTWGSWSGNSVYATRSCTNCGATQTCYHPSDKLSVEDSDEGTLRCKTCNLIIQCSHNLGSTYTDELNGQHHKSCTQCGHEFDSEDHSYTYTRTSNNKHKGTCVCGATAAEESCSEYDNGSGICSRCGESITKEEIKD